MIVGAAAVCVVVLVAGAGVVVGESEESRGSFFDAVDDGVFALDHECRILASAEGILTCNRNTLCGEGVVLMGGKIAGYHTSRYFRGICQEEMRSNVS